MRTHNEQAALPPTPVRPELVEGCIEQSRDARRPITAAILLLATPAGCVTVEAPDKPIVIELNVNIRQEVIYRLAADAQNTVEENADIF